MEVPGSSPVWPTLLLLGLAVGSSACASSAPPRERRGQAVLEGRGGNSLTGLATLHEDETGVWIELDLFGAPPGQHGVAVHSGDSCEGFYAGAAGPHFNPYRRPHGGREGEARHAGDMGNILVDAAGFGRLQAHLPGVTLASGGLSIAGRALVVTERPDDLVSPPAGNGGRPIACGVIALRRSR